MELKIREHVAAPPAKVFEVASDFARAPEFVRGIHATEILSDGPIGAGTRFRETRLMFKKEAVEEMEVTAFDPPNHYTLGCESHGCRYRSTFEFTPSGEGTDVELTFEATPLTAISKVMAFLMKPMMKTVMKECAKDLEDVKREAESKVETGSAS